MEFAILIGLWGGCFIVGSLVTIPIWMIMTGKSIFSMAEDMKNPAFTGALKVIQVVSTVIIFFVPAAITARIVSRHPFSHLGFRSGVQWKRAIVAALLMLCALPLVGYLADLNKAIPLSAGLKKFFDSMESQYMEQVRLMATFRNPLDYGVALVVIAFFPALVEEVFFRGSMQQIFHRWYKNPVLAIVVTSCIFSAIHFSWYGFIPRLTLGLVLGYIFYYSGNLWYSILAHFFNNALMVTILYWQYVQHKKIDMEVGEDAPWWAGLLSAAAVLFLFSAFRKMLATNVAPDSIATTTQDTNTFT
ncbi:MAG TPA: CPBP family intramembrane metalloprotease [Lacibacter sp.]|nr:CPBP family intramembrane metalloprotease [Lacibacter sp.]